MVLYGWLAVQFLLDHFLLFRCGFLSSTWLVADEEFEVDRKVPGEMSRLLDTGWSLFARIDNFLPPCLRLRQLEDLHGQRLIPSQSGIPSRPAQD